MNEPKYQGSLQITVDGQTYPPVTLNLPHDDAMFDFDDWISDSLREIAHFSRQLQNPSPQQHSVTISGSATTNNLPFFSLSVSYHAICQQTLQKILSLLHTIPQ